MTRKSSGEFYAQLKAEAANPRGDIWWGGTGDPHLQAAEEGLTEPYKSPNMGQQQDWAIRQWEASKGRTVGVYAGALGYSYNTDQLKKKNIPAPKCWADLTKPAFKDEIQVANPNSSGTSYTMLATFVQLMGEDKAFEFMKQMHKNVNQYTKSGAAPARAAATGETLVGITFQHDAVVQAVNGANVTIVSPCEGTGYEIGSMSIIKGAKNMENAKKWYDWALTPEAQSIAGNGKISFQVPSNKTATDSAAIAQARRHQAHQLRLRQVWVVGRAQPPAAEVGQGGLHAARSEACLCAPPALSPNGSPTVRDRQRSMQTATVAPAVFVPAARDRVTLYVIAAAAACIAGRALGRRRRPFGFAARLIRGAHDCGRCCSARSSRCSAPGASSTAARPIAAGAAVVWAFGARWRRAPPDRRSAGARRLRWLR